MSAVFITMFIFWGGLLAVLVVLILDELVARLGLQPGSVRWRLGPLFKAAGREKDRETKKKKEPGPTALTALISAGD